MHCMIKINQKKSKKMNFILCQAIFGWCFLIFLNAAVTIPTNPTERTDFLQEFLDGGRDSLPKGKKR